MGNQRGGGTRVGKEKGFMREGNKKVMRGEYNQNTLCTCIKML